MLAATALLYAPATRHAFTNWDDDRQITTNPDIRDLSAQGLRKMFTSFYVALYQPLTSLSFALEYRLFGLDPRVYHTVNVLLHVVNVLLVYLLARSLARHADGIGPPRTDPSRWGSPVALVTAALFAVHPLQVEVAAWVSSRSILLSTLLCLAAMIFYVAYATSGRRRYLAGALALFLPALLAKTTAATLPLLLVTLDFYLRRKLRWRLLAEKVPFLLLSAIFGGVTMFARSGLSHMQDFALKYSLVERVCIVCYSSLWYVGKLLVPTNLSVFYPFPVKTSDHLPVIFYLAPLLLLGLAAGIACAGRYRRPLAFTALFMLASLALVIQIIPISELMVCDRYAYVPCIGLFFLAATLSWRTAACRRSGKKALIVGLALILVILGGATHRRVGVWRDSLTLWNDVIDKRQDLWIAYQNRGLAHYERGAPQAAIADCDAALRLNPGADKSLNIRAAAYAGLGNPAAALRDFDSAIQVNPDPSYFANRGILKRKTGDLAGAVQDFDMALQLNPRNIGTLYERAAAYRLQANWAGAIADYQAVLRLNPAHAGAAFLLGATCLETGDGVQAVTMLEKALALGCPDPGLAYFFLAQAHHQQGRTDLARDALRRAQEAGYRGPPAESRPAVGPKQP
ncbi:MAG: tetratricopeptide repeat protein [Planctomycetes bacterium]|nr:tetratricopeptide repeat protein [Planctomycetota bacterium]